MNAIFNMVGDGISWTSLLSSTGINMIYSPENMKLMKWNKKFYLVVSNFKITLRRESYGVLYWTLTNLSCLQVCLTVKCEQNFLGEGKKRKFPVQWKFYAVKQKFHMVWKKNRKFWRGGVGVNDFGIQRAWGVEHFGISDGKGVKMFMPPLVRYGYFLESLNSDSKLDWNNTVWKNTKVLLCLF